jgi:branched-chain amino acid transport system ATP-binding protein
VKATERRGDAGTPGRGEAKERDLFSASARPPASVSFALELEGVTRSFGGLVAVADVTLSIAMRERRAIIGPNGAGKTTLFHLISGELPVTRGRIRLFGDDVTALPPHMRVGRGLGRTYQVTNIFPALSVQENVLLAAIGLAKTKFSFLSPAPSRGPLRERVEQALLDVSLQEKAHVQARELSHGEQRQLELALALAGRPRVLLLDEPAAGLSAAERALMANLIRNLPADLTLVVIEHDMDLALNLMEHVTCLHNGRVIADEPAATIARNQTVQDVYLGVG